MILWFGCVCGFVVLIGISSSADRGREFIDPWAPNAGPPAAGGGHFGGSTAGNGFGSGGSGNDSYGSAGGGGYGGSGGLSGYGSNGSGMSGGGYGGRSASGGHSADYAGGGGGHREGSGAGEDKNTTQVTIPKDVSGCGGVGVSKGCNDYTKCVFTF